MWMAIMYGKSKQTEEMMKGTATGKHGRYKCEEERKK